MERRGCKEKDVGEGCGGGAGGSKLVDYCTTSQHKITCCVRNYLLDISRGHVKAEHIQNYKNKRKLGVKKLGVIQ